MRQSRTASPAPQVQRVCGSAAGVPRKCACFCAILAFAFGWAEDGRRVVFVSGATLTEYKASGASFVPTGGRAELSLPKPFYPGLAYGLEFTCRHIIADVQVARGRVRATILGYSPDQGIGSAKMEGAIDMPVGILATDFRTDLLYLTSLDRLIWYRLGNRIPERPAGSMELPKSLDQKESPYYLYWGSDRDILYAMRPANDVIPSSRLVEVCLTRDGIPKRHSEARMFGRNGPGGEFSSSSARYRFTVDGPFSPAHESARNPPPLFQYMNLYGDPLKADLMRPMLRVKIPIAGAIPWYPSALGETHLSPSGTALLVKVHSATTYYVDLRKKKPVPVPFLKAERMVPDWRNGVVYAIVVKGKTKVFEEVTLPTNGRKPRVVASMVAPSGGFYLVPPP